MSKDTALTDRTMVPLSWVFITLIACAPVLIWMIRLEGSNTAQAAMANNLDGRVTSVESDIRVIREAQIRIETRMGLEPSYKMKGSADNGLDTKQSKAGR